MLGLLDGLLDGYLLGSLVGAMLGLLDGLLGGFTLGSLDGVMLGLLDGYLDGISLGSLDEVMLGLLDGLLDGISLESLVGVCLGCSMDFGFFSNLEKFPQRRAAEAPKCPIIRREDAAEAAAPMSPGVRWQQRTRGCSVRRWWRQRARLQHLAFCWA